MRDDSLHTLPDLTRITTLVFRGIPDRAQDCRANAFVAQDSLKSRRDSHASMYRPRTPGLRRRIVTGAFKVRPPSG